MVFGRSQSTSERQNVKQGWVKQHRAQQDWQWYDVPNTCRLYSHLTLMANHERQVWKGNVVERGQRLTSLPSLAHETGLSIGAIRTAIKNLQSSNDITVQTTNRFTLINIVDYSILQARKDDDNTHSDMHSNMQTTRTATGKRHAQRQANNTHSDIKQEEKNEKEEKNEEEVEEAAAADSFSIFRRTLEAAQMEAAAIKQLMPAFEALTLHRQELGYSINAATARCDAEYCCGLRTQHKIWDEAVKIPNARHCAELMMKTVRTGKHSAWFYDDAYALLVAGESGENITPPRITGEPERRSIFDGWA